ncbi:Myo-inositol-1-phosphate synthase [Puccinia graminis f. sp. tritici]|uniref:Myo-inositol-1-phosphate synthase n=1 Tax=Puccinia graminis f. sp. tritici TaxID=56615 RepID=A0A5B0QRM6_PUCGR|nr:Myo-inositol-1-phosphate synthase [Puccinia graminis f. sp. tritici]
MTKPITLTRKHTDLVLFSSSHNRYSSFPSTNLFAHNHHLYSPISLLGTFTNMSPPMAIPTGKVSNQLIVTRMVFQWPFGSRADRRPHSYETSCRLSPGGDTHILATSVHENTLVTRTPSGGYVLKPAKQAIEFKTERQVPTTGLMLVGWGGNNGTTVTATILANKHNISWRTREGIQTPNYIGSIVRASTYAQTGKDVHIPLSDMLPMVHPNDLVLGGWDISGMPLDQAMRRAKVMEWDLQDQLNPLMSQMKPLPSVYYPDLSAHLDQIRKDIRDFKAANKLDKVIVLWTANTERYSELIPGINDTARNLEQAVKNNHDEVSPSTIFAMACIYEGAPYINGAPQNTFVPDVSNSPRSLEGYRRR